MEIRQILRENSCNDLTPAYLFDLDELDNCINRIKKKLAGIPVTYSIKANPFLAGIISNVVEHVEVCSPGELAICKKYRIPGSKIIYSGVNKGEADIRDAIEYGVDICTVESLLQLDLIQKVSQQTEHRQKILMRLTSGNQFGMSKEKLIEVLSRKEKYGNLDFYGIHYYSGTLKRKKQIEKDIINLDSFLGCAKEMTGYNAKIVEYGPGLGCSYFDDNYRKCENELIDYLTEVIGGFAQVYHLGIEMGRFMTASCGKYITKIVDIKNNEDTNYVILDGGIHQLRYHGQNMAMLNPRIEVISIEDDICEPGDFVHYTLCGSLCTVADILINDIETHRLKIGDYIVFENCGAYSVSDANLAFLSRKMPVVGLWSENVGLRIVRNHVESFKLNCGEEV